MRKNASRKIKSVGSSLKTIKENESCEKRRRNSCKKRLNRTRISKRSSKSGKRLKMSMRKVTRKKTSKKSEMMLSSSTRRSNCKTKISRLQNAIAERKFRSFDKT